MQKVIIVAITAGALLTGKLDVSGQVVKITELSGNVEPVTALLSSLDRARILASVVDSRRTALGDTTKIRYCHAARVAGDSASLADALAQHHFRWDRFFRECVPGELLDYSQRVISIAKLKSYGDSAQVEIRVADPSGRTFLETYELVLDKDIDRWIVRRIEIRPGIVI